MKHKHYDLILAWANGADIEYFSPTSEMWVPLANPTFINEFKYRIKPEPKPDIVKYVLSTEKIISYDECYQKNLKLTFAGETKKLKSAEVLP